MGINMQIQSANDNAIAREKISEKTPPIQGQQSEQEAQKQKNDSKEEINKGLEQLNKMLGSETSYLQFIHHDKLNEYYVQVIDSSTKQVIREIPSKKVLDLAASLYEKLGFIIDKKI